MKRYILGILILAVILAYGCAQQSAEPAVGEKQAATAETGVIEINIEGFAFNPATIRIAKGTTVRWTQKDSTQHTVTSDDGVFGSPLLSKGETYSHTFNEAGTFDYHCTPHPSMKGKIIVE